MKNLSKSVLINLYHTKKLNPYEIGKILECDHKTVRRYLKLHNIKTRSASEYNFLPRISHKNPKKRDYTTKKSVAAHIAYLCEGWHTNKSTSFYFCNTDPNLCDLILWCLKNVYKVDNIRIRVLAKSEEHAKHLLRLYPDSKFTLDKERKTPITRIHAGGRALVRDFVQNAYEILASLE